MNLLPSFPFESCAHDLRRLTIYERVPPRSNVARGGRQPPRATRRATLRIHDPALCLGNHLLGWPLEGLEATKGIEAGRRQALVALISGVEPHNHLSLCLSHSFKIS
jgi:hypothetical protein